MPKILIVGNEQFEFPIEGENAGYGEQITDWANAVTDALTTVQKPNDIIDTTATISNNVTSFTSIPGFSFNTAQVISIDCNYRVQRSTVSPSVSLVESGRIEGNFNGTSWTIVVSTQGEAGIDFDITSAGQIQYKTSNMIGTSYTGAIVFRAKVFNG